MSLAEKLQLKEPGVRVLNAPNGVDLDDVEPIAKGEAVLLFAEKAADLGKHGKAVYDAARADKLAWIAYPKGGRLETDLDRDKLWTLVEPEGIKPVRQVAIDDTWSALRFRPAAAPSRRPVT